MPRLAACSTVHGPHWPRTTNRTVAWVLARKASQERHRDTPQVWKWTEGAIQALSALAAADDRLPQGPRARARATAPRTDPRVHLSRGARQGLTAQREVSQTRCPTPRGTCSSWGPGAQLEENSGSPKARVPTHCPRLLFLFPFLFPPNPGL